MDASKPKPLKTRKKAPPPAQGAAAVAQKLRTLSLIPLLAVAQGRNQSISSLLHDMTGLSKARISQGNLDAIRPSTQAKVERHLEQMLQQQFKENQEGLQELRTKMATAPVTRSGSHAALAQWVHQMEFLPWLPLPITKAVALAVDELLQALLACCRADDLQGFKSALLAHFAHHGQPVQAIGQSTAEPAPQDPLAALHVIADWKQCDDWTGHLTDYLYLDLISCLDAEWNSHYFSGRQSRPLFPLVMVRPQEGVMQSMKPASRRNIFFKPVRRLLEFLYALVHYARKKQWPGMAPTPSTLAGILYRPGSQEMDGERLINNYFDGTTKVTLERVVEHWDQLLQHFMPTRPESERPAAPYPLIMLALHWQTLLVQDKGQSFIVMDVPLYETLWERRKQQWMVLQAQQDTGTPKAGRPSMETIDWPAWSFSQSSSSC